jgi:hypothetical protein
VDGFDTEKLISEIESRPAIWKTECTEYANKNEKAKAWEEVCEIFYENFPRERKVQKKQIKYCSLFECIKTFISILEEKTLMLQLI